MLAALVVIGGGIQLGRLTLLIGVGGVARGGRRPLRFLQLGLLEISTLIDNGVLEKGGVRGNVSVTSESTGLIITGRSGGKLDRDWTIDESEKASGSKGSNRSTEETSSSGRRAS